ncbi:hypothetical protein F5884DRAFT_758581 [Xylogone sp. PMI_703]|nr:hypothetical protein F5884DRAFT_758581 [Xylogone sp. PMI_703]
MSQRQTNLLWTPEMETALLEELLSQSRMEKRSDQGWKREAWEAVRHRVQMMYTGPLTITIDQVKNKETSYRSKYKEFTFLEENSGFGLENGRITAPESVWESLI